MAVIQSDKQIDFSVTTLSHSQQVWAMQSGTDEVSGTYTVQAKESLKCVAAKFTLEGTPEVLSTSCIIIDAKGEQHTGVIAVKEVSFAVETPVYVPVEGGFYTVIYSSSVVGTSIEFDSEKFAHNYYIELHSIAYDTNSEICANIFFIFNKCVPDGNMKGGFDGGKNTGDDMKFTALTESNSSSIGRLVVIPVI